MEQKLPAVLALDYQIGPMYAFFVYSRGDRQMTEISVSGTDVFSDAKMTETPYE